MLTSIVSEFVTVLVACATHNGYRRRYGSMQQCRWFCLSCAISCFQQLINCDLLDVNIRFSGCSRIWICAIVQKIWTKSFCCDNNIPLADWFYCGAQLCCGYPLIVSRLILWVYSCVKQFRVRLNGEIKEAVMDLQSRKVVVNVDMVCFLSSSMWSNDLILFSQFLQLPKDGVHLGVEFVAQLWQKICWHSMEVICLERAIWGTKCTSGDATENCTRW